MSQTTDTRTGSVIGLDAMVFTTCTDRKRIAPAPTLSARDLNEGSQQEVACEWRARVSSASTKTPASEVYSGRAFREAERTSHAIGATFWVISGGLGLVKSDKRIPSYRLTLSSGSSDSISRKIAGSCFSPPAWWGQINRHRSTGTPIADLVRENSHKVVLMALSGPYARLVSQDLASLTGNELKRVRLFGRRLTSVLPNRIHEIIMPYDARMDGPDSPLPGTLSDLAQRCLRHFVCHICSELPDGRVSQHRSLVLKALRGLRFPEPLKRERKTDAEIIELILHLWDRAEGKSGRMLRHLRDIEDVACEQGRFRKLFVIASAKRLDLKKELATA